MFEIFFLFSKIGECKGKHFFSKSETVGVCLCPFYGVNGNGFQTPIRRVFILFLSSKRPYFFRVASWYISVRVAQRHADSCGDPTRQHRWTIVPSSRAQFSFLFTLFISSFNVSLRCSRRQDLHHVANDKVVRNQKKHPHSSRPVDKLAGELRRLDVVVVAFFFVIYFL